MSPTKTIAFLDLCDFSAYTTRHGDYAAVEVVTGFQDVVLREATAHDVEIVKWLGDGVMLASPDEAAAAGCAKSIRLELRRAIPLLVRGGLATGPVRRVGEDYLGATVNRAARVCDRAIPGEIVDDGSATTVAGHHVAVQVRSTRDLVVASLLRNPER